MSAIEKKTTLVVGLGEVGRPLLTLLQRHKPETIGIDVEPVVADAPVGIMHICFPFNDRAQFQEVTLAYARKYVPHLIIINSTVVPGATREIESICGIPCVYSPVRGKHARMTEELCNYVKFVAGTNTQATEQVMEHFRSVGIRSESMASPEVLELAKLLETTYFGLLIAWAQEMNRFAQALTVDYLEVGKFFREIPYLPPVLFQPGFIGGHCVMSNINLLQQRFQSDFLDVVKSSNENRKHELERAEQQSAVNRLQPMALK